jgi:hypothetical protein
MESTRCAPGAGGVVLRTTTLTRDMSRRDMSRREVSAVGLQPLSRAEAWRLPPRGTFLGRGGQLLGSQPLSSRSQAFHFLRFMADSPNFPGQVPRSFTTRIRLHG